MEDKTVRLNGQQIAQLVQQERDKLGETNRRIASFQNFRTEMYGARDALAELGKNGKGEKMLVNLGAGIFVHAIIDDTEKGIASLTGNVFRETDRKELEKMLEQRIAEIDKATEKAAQEQQHTLARLTQLEQVLSAGMQYMQRQQK
ncbi:MAG: prefoldin subunit alpha [Candidatus Diapherotrites archaeon]|uniref:Prefoldin subunit alpha n=1 Tax=Candidatus Iainarchaeum sp. TaxID=3101447 RepID=A0A8T3YN48_9ARCH|nr:prefoldin subunit alpha [Candidatus Diapherotrites archaeon]